MWAGTVSVLKEVFPILPAYLAAGAAIFASCQAEEFVAWKKSQRHERISAGAEWRIHAGEAQAWRRLGFDDSGWPRAELGHGSLGLPTGELQHMWGAVDTSVHELTFRRRFACPDRDRIERVTLISAANDDERVYLNGIAVVSDRDRSAGPVFFTDVTPFIRSGDNIVAIEVEDVGGGAWLVADIGIQRR
jgi:hypothetical protein